MKCVDNVYTQRYNIPRGVNMKNSTIHIRLPEEEKLQAVKTLEQLGLDLSTYLRMALRQVVLKNSIPFNADTLDEGMNYVKATMELEGMPLTADMIQNMKDYDSGVSSNEIIERIKKKYG